MDCRVVLKGAMLNQATKVRKKAIHVKCRMACCFLLNPNITLVELGSGSGNVGHDLVVSNDTFGIKFNDQVF